MVCFVLRAFNTLEKGFSSNSKGPLPHKQQQNMIGVKYVHASQ